MAVKVPPLKGDAVPPGSQKFYAGITASCYLSVTNIK